MADIKHLQKGFALIVMALLLVVFGLLLSTFKPGKGSSEHAKYVETQRRFEVVSKALQEFYTENTKYPCPASRTNIYTDSNYGVATTCTSPASTCPAGIACPTDGSSYVLNGAVPTRAINLSDDYMYDAWGNRMIYAVDLNRINGVGSKILRVKSVSGVYMNNPPPYYLGSTGTDGYGAYSHAGQVPATRTCASDPNNDKPNCLDTTYEFISDKWKTTGGTKAGATRSFDDLMANSDVNSIYKCPAGIKGCSLWLDASDVDGDGYAGNDPVNNTTIQNWQDKSTNAFIATQSSAIARPTYKTNLIYSKPAIRFSTNQSLVIPQMQNGTAHTWFVVHSFPSAQRGLIYCGDNTMTGLEPYSTTASGFAVHKNGVYDYGAANSGNSGQWYMETFAAPKGNVSASSLYVNGSPLPMVFGSGSDNAVTCGTSFGIGVGNITTGDIDVAEIIIYNRVLTNLERKQVECYLGQKYNIQSPCSCPAKVAGCKLWLSASDLNGTGVYTSQPANGTAISTWVDKSGNGYNAVQANPSLQPLMHYAAINNLPAVLFDGANSELDNTALPGKTTSTTFSVLNQQTGGPSFQTILAGSSPSQMSFFFGSSSDNFMTLFGTDLAWDDATTANSPAVSVTSPHVLSLTNDSTTARPYVDGTAQTTRLGSTIAFTGYNIGLPSQNFKGDLAELIYYDRALSDNEREKVECYLARKYGNIGNFPSTYCTNLSD